MYLPLRFSPFYIIVLAVFQYAACVPVLLSETNASASFCPVTINLDHTYQRIDGFGGCFVTYDRQPAFDDPLFYRLAVEDVGLTIIRVPVFAVEEAANDNEDAAVFDQTYFDQDDFQFAGKVLTRFKEAGIETFMASLWSPPHWMKTNNSKILGGHLRPDMREEFAEYLVAFINGLQTHYGIELHAISPQNELLFVEPYDSCVYSPIHLRETTRALMRRFAVNDVSTNIILPEDMGFAERHLAYIRPVMHDPETSQYPGFFCSHGWRNFDNWNKMGAGMAQYGRKYWMTETSGHNPTWEGALAMVRDIHMTLVGGNASAYVYWQVNGWQPGRFTLMGGGRHHHKSYAMKHFARFIRPGAVRIYAHAPDPEILVSAYYHDYTQLISLVCINVSDTEKTIRLYTPRTDLAQGWAHYFSDQAIRCELLGYTHSGNDIALKPESVSTFIKLKNSGKLQLASMLPKPVNLESEDIHQSNAEDKEQLHAAARQNQLGRAKSLLIEGADPNAPNVSGLTPLHRSAWPGHVEMAELLVQWRADVDVRDAKGQGPLHIAAGRGHLEYVQQLIELGADPNLADHRGLTPLHMAALAANLDTAKVLIESGAQVDTPDAAGWTPLHKAAASSGDHAPVLVELLLEMGADPMARNRDNWTPLHAVLANSGMGNWKMPNQACRKIQALLDAGAEVDAADANGRTPLAWAAMMGQCIYLERDGLPEFVYGTETAEVLLHAGADPTAVDSGGRSAADHAREQGFEALIKLLDDFEKGELILSVANVVKPAGMDGAEHDRLELSRQLLRVVTTAPLEEVAALLESGADPNYMATYGGSSLHKAVAARKVSLIKLLLEYGANPSLPDSDGYSATGRAEQSQMKDIHRLLLDLSR